MFCSHCGATLETSQTHCPSCGKPIVTMPPTESRVVRHLRLLGILWIALSTIRLLGAGVVLIVANTLFRGNGGAEWRVGLVYAILSLVGGVLLIMAVAGIAAGWGLLTRQSWARILALIVAFVSLLDIPLGTALGVYTLWALLPSEAEEEYTRIARPA